MKNQNDIHPPRWATRFLSWYCKDELLEDLEGDLHEYFERNVISKGATKAKLIYIIDVFKFLRLYTIRKPEFVNLLINWIMLGSYIKTSGRTIVRNKLFSTINIVGLAISMSVGLLLIGMLSDIFSYDKFHVNHKRIYRVISHYEYLDQKDGNFMATTSLKAAKEIAQTFSVPEEVAILSREFTGDMKAGEKVIPLSGFWSNPAFFKVFSFQLVQGNQATALKDPYSVVLTEKSARKLFGDEPALGKVVTLNNDKQYTVTGILKDLPTFSHMQFDMLGSLVTSEANARKDDLAWDNVWGTWVYLLLPPDADLTALKTSLDELSKREDPTVKNTHIELALQPMDDIMLGQNLGNQIGATMGRSSMLIFAGLAFIVILSAGFNYTNLSIARSLKRTREVGIRKVIGALKRDVMGQFVVEAVIISLCAVVIAILLFVLLKPYFLNIEPSIQKVFLLNLSPKLLLYFIGFAIMVGMAAGFFPALFFSKINAALVLKKASNSTFFKKLTVRKVLIVFQYCISIIFITSTIVVYKQYKHFITFDLGFKTENILNIALQGNKAEILTKEFSELPEVTGVSQSLMVTSVGNYWGTYVKYYQNPNDSLVVGYNTVDENYIPLHGHKLLAGRNFTARADSSESEVIVNQAVLKRFNIAGQNPEKALGEILKVDGKNLRIVAVMKNFHYGRANARESTKEVMFRYSNKTARLVNVKIKTQDILATYAKIQAIWKKVDPIHPMKAKFYSEQIEEAFSGLKASVKVAGFLAFLAICISSLGLLGMVVFTTETRLKEISIRKVMGASEIRLLYLLGKGFFLLLAIATLISIPTTVLFFEKIAFPELANHAPLALGEMLLGVVAVMVVALAMIGTQTIKVARANPAEVLKNE